MINEVETFVTFEAAHRLYDVDTYSEECRANLHGHSYGTTIVVSREPLNDAGMVVDFKKMKEVIKETIEDPFDHSCILKADDPIAPVIQENCKKVHIVHDNPTAEWMAKFFFESLVKAFADVDLQLKVMSVSVRETEHNIATYRRS